MAVYAAHIPALPQMQMRNASPVGGSKRYDYVNRVTAPATVSPLRHASAGSQPLGCSASVSLAQGEEDEEEEDDEESRVNSPRKEPYRLFLLVFAREPLAP